MMRKTKWRLLLAVALLVVGLILTIGGMKMLQWNISALGLPAYDTATYELTDPVSSLTIEAGTADVTITKTTNEYGRVVCYEKEKQHYAVGMRGDELVITLDDQRKWYERLFSYGQPNITVYLPEGEYTALKIKNSTGDVNVRQDFRFDSADITASTGDVTCEAAVSGEVKIALSTGNISFTGKTAGALSLSVSTGHVSVENTAVTDNVSVRVSTGKATLKNVTCASFSSTGDTGDLMLTDVVATGALTVERSTGDVKFVRCDAAELDVKTDTGDVTGSLCSEKIFFAKSDTGKVNVPECLTGGKCKVETDTGKIMLTVEQ